MQDVSATLFNGLFARAFSMIQAASMDQRSFRKLLAATSACRWALGCWAPWRLSR
jgi:hypothetical protein